MLVLHVVVLHACQCVCVCVCVCAVLRFIYIIVRPANRSVATDSSPNRIVCAMFGNTLGAIVIVQTTFVQLLLFRRCAVSLLVVLPDPLVLGSRNDLFWFYGGDFACFWGP